MDKWFQSKWFVRGIALALAILLYISVNIDSESVENDNLTFFPSSSPETQTVEDVPVEIRMDSEKYVVSGIPEFVTVQLEGTSATLVATARQRNFDVYVDLEGLEAGEHTVRIQTDVPSELTATVEPEFIDIVIEERATEEFKVNVDFLNNEQLPEGYEIGEIEVNPETVLITSSKSVVEQIGIVKVYVDVKDTSESIENRAFPVNVYDSQGNELRVRIEPETVSVSVEINNPSKNVSVSVPTTGTLPEGLSLVSIEPNIEEVEIFATSNTLEGIDEIKTKAVNLSDITESGTVDLQLELPEGVQAPDIDAIEVSIELEQTKQLEDILIDIEHLNDGQEVTFIEPEEQTMSITIVGNEQDVSEITDEDIRVYIDVEDLEDGEHQVPILIEGPEGVTINPDMELVTIEILTIE
ncbi:CdaR family protein [Ornithinibacillus halophilus]|uniref:YbbR domain-containing protein n=1 Tax=Ornithinibacillus halophilus TaxID=930117 RepID=A0A1M5E194_9BACI|nr:CdaR family protein [Ornithinibacillus halophilus]SHF73038.1 YbbR domain-containing protein [Ornithinibacillus halophilus]